jgi:hypothetical protein
MISKTCLTSLAVGLALNPMKSATPLYLSLHSLSQITRQPRARITKAMLLRVIEPDAFNGDARHPLFDSDRLDEISKAVRGPLAGPLGRAFAAGFANPTTNRKRK